MNRESARIPRSARPERVHFIVNPRAGRNAAAELIDVVRARLAGHLPFEWHVSTSPEDARELARDLDVDETGAICAVGGDGTVHAVANGILARQGSRPSLAVLPAGTGNSLAVDLELDSAEEALDRMLAGHATELDAARVELDGHVHFAINVIGWGAFARINRRAESLRLFGGTRYNFAAAAELLRPLMRHSEARIDGEPAATYLLGAACITQHTGKGMRIAPRATLDDGYLDLVLIRSGNRVQLATILARVFDGGHVTSSKVEYRRVEGFNLRLDGDGRDIVIDGELLHARHVKVSVVPRALLLLGAPPIEVPELPDRPETLNGPDYRSR